MRCSTVRWDRAVGFPLVIVFAILVLQQSPAAEPRSYWHQSGAHEITARLAELAFRWVLGF
jgi:hypothetical protein